MKYKRLFIGLFFALLLLLLLLYNYQEYEKNDVQIKKYKEVFENPEKYNNTEISFTAQVKKINETNKTMIVIIDEIPYSYPLVELNINNLVYNISSFKKGDLIDIIGILDGKDHVIVKKIWINDQWKNALIYIRSIFAIPFVLYLFFKAWIFNWKKMRFDRRNRDS